MISPSTRPALAFVCPVFKATLPLPDSTMPSNIESCHVDAFAHQPLRVSRLYSNAARAAEVAESCAPPAAAQQQEFTQVMEAMSDCSSKG